MHLCVTENIHDYRYLRFYTQRPLPYSSGTGVYMKQYKMRKDMEKNNKLIIFYCKLVHVCTYENIF